MTPVQMASTGLLLEALNRVWRLNAQVAVRTAVTSTPSLSPSGTTEVIFQSPSAKLMRSSTLSASVSLSASTRNVAGWEAESCAASRRSAPVPQITPAQTIA